MVMILLHKAYGKTQKAGFQGIITLFGSGYKCHEISNHRQIIYASNPCICNSTFKNFFRATGYLFILGRNNSSIALDKIQNPLRKRPIMKVVVLSSTKFAVNIGVAIVLNNKVNAVFILEYFFQAYSKVILYRRDLLHFPLLQCSIC